MFWENSPTVRIGLWGDSVQAALYRTANGA